MMSTSRTFCTNLSIFPLKFRNKMLMNLSGLPPGQGEFISVALVLVQHHKRRNPAWLQATSPPTPSLKLTPTLTQWTPNPGPNPGEGRFEFTSLLHDVLYLCDVSLWCHFVLVRGETEGWWQNYHVGEGGGGAVKDLRVTPPPPAL